MKKFGERVRSQEHALSNIQLSSPFIVTFSIEFLKSLLEGVSTSLQKEETLKGTKENVLEIASGTIHWCCIVITAERGKLTRNKGKMSHQHEDDEENNEEDQSFSGYDYEEEDEMPLADDDDDGGPRKLRKLNRMVSYKIHEVENVLATQHKAIEHVSELLGLDKHDAAVLLRHHKWDKEIACDAWWNAESSEIRHKIGLPPTPVELLFCKSETEGCMICQRIPTAISSASDTSSHAYPPPPPSSAPTPPPPSTLHC